MELPEITTSSVTGKASDRALSASDGRLAQRVKLAWKKMLAYWPLWLAPVLLLPGLAAFPYPSPDSAYSDLTITHYPAAVYLLGAIRQWHTIPLWSPAILGGYPFAADPLSGLWYPPGWLALLFPLPLGLNLMAALHLLWGGWGAYRLFLGEGRSHQAALLGGLAFGALPKLFAHYGAGHLTLIYAVAWTPWLILAARGCLKPGARRASPAVIFALILLADIRWGVYAGALWGCYHFAHSHAWGKQTKRSQTWRRGIWQWQLFWRRQIRWAGRQYPAGLLRLVQAGGSLVFQVIPGLMLAAPLLAPFIEYARLSTRALMQSGDVLAYSLPPARLLGLLYPHLGVFHEWTLYPGSLILLLTIWGQVAGGALSGGALTGGAWSGGALKSGRFWLWMALGSLVFSLGANFPLLPALAGLPGLNLLRVPPRALFVFGLALAALAAHGFDSWLASQNEARLRLGRMAIVGAGSLSLALAAGQWSLTGFLTRGVAWGAATTFLAVVWLLAQTRLEASSPRQAWYWGALGLLAIDLAWVNLQAYSPRPAQAVLSQGAALAGYFQKQAAPQEQAAPYVKAGSFRVYSPSYSLPQQAAAEAGLELADGVNPIQLASYAGFMQMASGIPFQGYSVTLPPFAGETPESANQDYLPSPALLARLNVRYVAAEYDLPVDGLELRQKFGETRLYEIPQARPRAWVQPPGAGIHGMYRRVDWLAWTPNAIVIQAEGPGRLVVSENAYPGWRAWVDGAPAALEVEGGLLRAVEIPAGKHRVRLTFRPLSLYLGLGTCLLALIWIAVRFSLDFPGPRRLFGHRPVCAR